MSKRFWNWATLLLGGTLLLATSVQGCLANNLRDFANQVDNHQTTLGDVGNSLQSWWDGLWN